MAVNYYQLGKTESRINQRQRTAAAHINFFNLTAKALDYSEQIVNLVTQQKEEAQNAAFDIIDTQITTSLVTKTDSDLEALANSPDIMSNPDMFTASANDILATNFSEDSIYNSVKDKGVSLEQVQAYMQTNQFQVYKNAGAAAVQELNTAAVITNWQTAVTQNMTTAAEGADSITEAIDSAAAVYADSGNTTVLDKYGQLDPSKPSNRASIGATWLASNAQSSMTELIADDPYISEDEAIAGYISQYDELNGDLSQYNVFEQGNINATRETLETELRKQFKTSKDEYNTKISDGIAKVNSNIGVGLYTGQVSVEDVYAEVKNAGLDGKTADQQSAILDWVTTMTENASSYEELASMGEAIEKIADSYGYKPKVDSNDAFAVGYALLYGDEFATQDENDVRPSYDSNSDIDPLDQVFQRAFDIVAYRAEEIYSQNIGAVQNQIVNGILYHFTFDDEQKMSALDYSYAQGLIGAEKYSEAINDIASGKIKTSYSVAANNTIELVNAYIDTLGLNSADKAMMRWILTEGEGKKNIYNLVVKANGNTPRQDEIETLVNNAQNAIFEEDFFNEYNKQIAERTSWIPGTGQPVTSFTRAGDLKTTDKIGSLLFDADGGEESLTTFYQNAISGDYDFIMDKDKIGILKEGLMNTNLEPKTQDELFEDASQLLYGKSYDELDTWQKNSVEVNTAMAFCEAVQVADLANIIDEGKSKDRGYREVNVPGFGKGLLTKGGVLLYSKPYDLENTWGTKQYMYQIIDVTSDEYKSVWGANADTANATVLANPVSSKGVKVPKNKNGKYIPLTESTAEWKYMLGNSYGISELKKKQRVTNLAGGMASGT